MTDYQKNEVNFLLGDSTSCAEVIDDILKEHGYDLPAGAFMLIEADDDMDLAQDICDRLTIPVEDPS